MVSAGLKKRISCCVISPLLLAFWTPAVRDLVAWVVSFRTLAFWRRVVSSTHVREAERIPDALLGRLNGD